METKKCCGCNDIKLLTEFYVTKGKEKGQSHCKKCFNKYCVDRWVQKKIDAILYKGGRCIDCNLQYPELPYPVFEFHHLDPNKKDVSWTKLRLRSKEKIHKELDKCVLLCANCHRIRHHEEK
jgi:hypothetical protein